MNETEKPYKIVFVTNNYRPYSGGVVSSINSSVRALREAGHEVHIITLDFLGDKHKQDEWTHRVPSLLRFSYKNKHVAIPWRHHRHVARLVQHLRPDVVHVHHPFLLGQSGRKAARKTGVPCVFTYHTMYQDYVHYIPLPAFITRPLVTYLVKRFCRLVDRIIAPSKAVQQELARARIDNVHIVPSSIQTIFFNAKAPIRERNAVTDPFCVLVVSRFEPEKNLPFLLEVLTRLDARFKTVFIGYGTEYEQLQTYAYETLGLSPTQVIFVNKPNKQRLKQYYADADLFLFSSQTDAQGLVLAEAMASATPVVALDGPGQRDIVVDGENGFLVTNAHEMVARINEIANDPDLHVRLQHAAWQRAQAYRPSNICDKLVQLYRNVAGL